MHGAGCLELQKLPVDVDGWKIQLALHDITGWMHASKNNARPLTLPWYRWLWITNTHRGHIWHQGAAGICLVVRTSDKSSSVIRYFISPQAVNMNYIQSFDNTWSDSPCIFVSYSDDSMRRLKLYFLFPSVCSTKLRLHTSPASFSFIYGLFKHQFDCAKI